MWNAGNSATAPTPRRAGPFRSIAIGASRDHRASTADAPSALPGRHSPHWWRADADGDDNNYRHNTISLTATIYYPFHPMQGRELSVTSRSRNPELPVTVVDETGAGLRIPAWMVAPEAAHYQLAEQATLDVQTLRALAALLIPLLDDGFDGGEGLSNTCIRR